MKNNLLMLCAISLAMLSGCATQPKPGVGNVVNGASQSACAEHIPKAVDATLRGQGNQFSGDLYSCQMRERMKTVTTSTAVGATIGATIGAIAGKVTGVGAGTGALAGGALGGLLGYGYGSLAADRDEAADQMAIAEQALGILQTENQNLSKYIAQAEKTLAEDEQKLNDLKEQLKRRKITREAAEQEAQRLNETKTALLETVGNLKKRKEMAAQTVPQNDAKFVGEMDKYQQQISKLENIANQIPERRIQAVGPGLPS